jgi:Zn-dependent protease/CBS domain-containing protein
LKKFLSFKVHNTWILIFGLVTVVLATQFSEDFPLWQKIIMGIVVAFLFLLTTALRELVLSLAAYQGRVPVREITLYVFGGVYQEYRKRIVSIHWPLLYITRLLSNLVIAAIFYGLFATFVSLNNTALAGMAQWLVYIYTLVFLLNFVPAFPLDGGQILRLILWRTTGDYYKATHLSSVIGWAVGSFAIFSSVLVYVLTRQWVVSLTVLIIGWIIQISANYTRRRFKTVLSLQSVSARDIMIVEYPALSSQINLEKLVQDYILIKGWVYLLVIDGQKLEGLLTLRQIKSVPMKAWSETTIGAIMTPSDRITMAHSHKTAAALLEEMDQMDQDYIPILEEDHVIGVVTRSSLMSLARTRAGFGL